ncbi:BTB/POZ domain-containing protein 6-like [Paramacrobiotus metropolitanus]|uniref:BTB/POZ domain-containing protein 6-like n=1 Tax=Paramacrobiotus metropolitanus TaxID=2943436 RepID=UPI0024456F9F|nr:BTB/POZ domain-containing protein 6-like [Paramacrobiotus metropolitanus]
MSKHPSETGSTIPESRDPGSGIILCIKEMLSSGDLSDVSFTVGRLLGEARNFSAHKVILAARSPVFRAMLYGSLPENCDAPIDISDILPEAFANLLSFLYTDAMDALSMDNVLPTMGCADKYDVPRLVAICSDFVISQLNPENCLAMLEEAFYWNFGGVVEKCLDFTDSWSEAILQSGHFTNISQETLEMILQRNTLSVEENEIYVAVESWARAACSRNGLDPSAAANRRQMLGSALFLVRFPLMTNAQLADGPGTSGLLSEAEITSIFLFLNARVKPPLPFSSQRRIGSMKVDRNFSRDSSTFPPGEDMVDWLICASSSQPSIPRPISSKFGVGRGFSFR